MKAQARQVTVSEVSGCRWQELGVDLYCDVVGDRFYLASSSNAIRSLAAPTERVAANPSYQVAMQAAASHNSGTTYVSHEAASYAYAWLFGSSTNGESEQMLAPLRGVGMSSEGGQSNRHITLFFAIGH